MLTNELTHTAMFWILVIAEVVLGSRVCDHWERGEFCPGFPDINPQQGTCRVYDNGTIDTSGCTRYSCRPSEQLLHCGNYNLGCTVTCEGQRCGFEEGSCLPAPSAFPSVDGIVFCDDEQLTMNCRNPSQTRVSWIGACGASYGDKLYRNYSGHVCGKRECSPPASLDRCGAYTTECDLSQESCTQLSFQSALPIRRCTPDEHMRSGAVFHGDCGVICEDESLQSECRLVKQGTDASGWAEVTTLWEQCNPIDHASACPKCRRLGNVFEVLCHETPWWTSIKSSRNVACPRSLAKSLCGSSVAACTQYGCDQYGRDCNHTVCDLEPCTEQEQFAFCGTNAPGCRKVEGRLESCGVVTPGIPFDPSPLGRHCRRSGGTDFCLFPWSVGQFVGPGQVPQYDGARLRTCSADESRRYCGPMWERDDRRRPCKLLSCDRSGINCTIVKGSCGCPSHSPAEGFPCGSTKTCDNPSEFCGEGADDCTLECRSGICHARTCHCMDGRRPWPLDATNCIGVLEDWAGGCQRVGLRGTVTPRLDYLACDTYPGIRRFTEKANVRARPLATSRHLLQDEGIDPNIVRVREQCGPFARTATLNSSTNTIEAGTCVCEPGYFQGPSSACELDYFVVSCNESDVPPELLTKCPGYTCKLRCYGEDNCTKRDDPLGCLNVTYTNVSCPSYMSEYFCGEKSSCRADCSWGADLAFTKSCNIWEGLVSLVSKDTPFGYNHDANGTTTYDQPMRVKEFLGTVCHCDAQLGGPGFGFDVRPCGHDYSLRLWPISLDPINVIKDCGAYATAAIYRFTNGTRGVVDSCICSGTYQPTITVEPVWSPFLGAKWVTRTTHCGGILEDLGVCSSLETQCGPLTMGVLTILNYTGQTPRNAYCICRDGAVSSIGGIDCAAFTRPCRLDEVRDHGVCPQGSRSCTVRCEAVGNHETCQVIPSTCSTTAATTRPCRQEEVWNVCGTLSTSCEFDTLALEVIRETCTCHSSAVMDVQMRYGRVCQSRHYTFRDCTETEAQGYCGNLGRSEEGTACRYQVVWLDKSLMLLVDETSHPDFPPPVIDNQLEQHFWHSGADRSKGSLYVADVNAGGFRVADSYSGSIPVEYPQCLCKDNPWLGRWSTSSWRSTFDYNRFASWKTSNNKYGYIRCEERVAANHRASGWCPTNGDGVVCNGVGRCDLGQAETSDGSSNWEQRQKRNWWDSLQWDDNNYNLRSTTRATTPTVYTPFFVTPEPIPTYNGQSPYFTQSQETFPMVSGAFSWTINWPTSSYPFILNSRYYIRTSGRWPPVSLYMDDTGFGLKAWKSPSLFDAVNNNFFEFDKPPSWTSPDEGLPRQDIMSKPITSGVMWQDMEVIMRGASVQCGDKRCLPPNVTDSAFSVFSIYADPRDGGLSRIRWGNRVLVASDTSEELEFASDGYFHEKWQILSLNPQQMKIPSDVRDGDPYIVCIRNFDTGCYITLDEDTHAVRCIKNVRARSSWWTLSSVLHYGLAASTVMPVPQGGNFRLTPNGDGGYSGTPPSSQPTTAELFTVIPVNDYTDEFLLLDSNGKGVNGHSYDDSERRLIKSLGSNNREPGCQLSPPRRAFYSNMAQEPNVSWSNGGKWRFDIPGGTSLYQISQDRHSLGYYADQFANGGVQCNTEPLLSVYAVPNRYPRDPHGIDPNDQIVKNDYYQFSVIGGRLRSCLPYLYFECRLDFWYTFYDVSADAYRNTMQTDANAFWGMQQCLNGQDYGTPPQGPYFDKSSAVYNAGDLQPCPDRGDDRGTYYFIDCHNANRWAFVPVQYSAYQYDPSVHGRLDPISLAPTFSYLPLYLDVTVRNYQPAAAFFGLPHPLRPLRCSQCGPYLTGNACEIRKCAKDSSCEKYFVGTPCEGKDTGCALNLSRENAYNQRGMSTIYGVLNWTTGDYVCDHPSLLPGQDCGWVTINSRDCRSTNPRLVDAFRGRDCGIGNTCERGFRCVCKGLNQYNMPSSNCTQTNASIFCNGGNSSAPSCNGRGVCDGKGSCHTCMSGPNEYWEGTLCDVPRLRQGCHNGGTVTTNGSAIYCACTPTWTGPSCNMSLCPMRNGLPCSGVEGACHIDKVSGRASCTDMTTGKPRCRGNTDLAGCVCQLSEQEECQACNLRAGTQNICDLAFNSSGLETLSCSCPVAFTGKFCQTPTCGSCGTKGVCSLIDGIPQCVCESVGWPSVFAGPQCDVDVTSACGRIYADNAEVLTCDSTRPNTRGRCVADANGTYGCVCRDPGTDKYCHNSRCSSRCTDGSTCKEVSAGDFQCVCDHPEVLAMDVSTGTCTVNNCRFGARPSPQGTSCQCPDLRAEYSASCVLPAATATVYRNATDGCLYDKGSGERCGVTYLFGKRTTPGYGVWSDTVRKLCINGTCVCKEGYQLGSAGTCVPLCDIGNTELIVASGAVAFCRCAIGYNATSGCHTRVCDGRGLWDSKTNLCACNKSLVYGGSLCGSSLCVHGSPSADGTDCTCDVGYGGRLCDQRDCGLHPERRRLSDCACAFPYTGINCEASLCRHGTPYLKGCNCTGTIYDTDIFCTGVTCPGVNYNVTANGECVCSQWWSGNGCNTFDCGDHGVFDPIASSCVCNPGYDMGTDKRCDVVHCPSGLITFQGETLCNCPDGYRASATEGCEPICLNGGANALDDTCKCPTGLGGTFCDVRTTTDLPVLPGSEPEAEVPNNSTVRRQSLLVQLYTTSPIDSSQIILEVAEILNVSSQRVSIYHSDDIVNGEQNTFLYVNATLDVRSAWAALGTKPCSYDILSHLVIARCGGSSGGAVLSPGVIAGIAVGGAVALAILLKFLIKKH